MTVPQNPNTRTEAVGNGVSVVFPFDFLCLEERDLQVSVSDTILSPSQYSVSGLGQLQGGSVTFVSAPAAGVPILMELAVVAARTIDYQDNGDLFAQTVNFDFDRLWLAIKSAFGWIRRALVLGPYDVDGAGSYRANNNRIQDLADPAANQDAVNYRSMFSFVTEYVDKAIAGVVGGFGWFLQSGVGSVYRTFQDKMRDSVNAADFGAVGDGVADDTLAIQTFFTYLAATGKRGVAIGEFLITSQIHLDTPARGFAFQGGGKGVTKFKLRATAGGNNGFNFINLSDTLLEGFSVDVGFTETGFGSHGISIRNPQRVKVRDFYASNYSQSAGLMFCDEINTYGDSHFIDCSADGSFVGQNGWLLVDMLYSTVDNCSTINLSPTGSPCVGLQLKNQCKHSRIIGGYAQGCKAGVGMGGDGDVAGSAGFNCVVSGVTVRDCLDGAIIGKTTDCSVEIFADMTNSPAPVTGQGYALNVTGFNARLNAVVTIDGVQAGRTSIRIGSSDTTVRVPYASDYGDKLFLIETGVQRARLFVENLSGDVSNVVDLVTDNSGTTSNEIYYARTARNSALTGNPTIYFRSAGAAQTYITADNSNSSMVFRTGGSDRLLVQTTVIGPGADNAYASASTIRRWSTVFAATGTINTSDAREKTDVRGLLPNELAAAKALAREIGIYQWLSAIESKGIGNARLHVGMTVQRAIQVMQQFDIDPLRYGFICHDEWTNEHRTIEAVTRESGLFDELGNPIMIVETPERLELVTAAGDRYSFRMDELLAFMLCGVVAEQDQHESRLAALEARP